MNNKISIITVNYNDRPGLQKTIDSVFNQSSGDFEFIVIDGGSNDGSKELIGEHAARFTYSVSEPDKGIYHAMNKGIRVATGDYLLFLNSGDYLHDDQVMENVDRLIDGKADIFYGDIIYDEAGNRRVFSFPEELTFSFFYVQNLSHQASFIRRSLFYDLFFYNEDFKIVSDWEFFTYAICKHNVSYQHLDLLVTTYDATGISSNLENHQLMNLERAQSISRYFPALAADYRLINEFKSKKSAQFLHIRKYPFAWKVLKALINFLLLFLPKFKNND